MNKKNVRVNIRCINFHDLTGSIRDIKSKLDRYQNECHEAGYTCIRLGLDGYDDYYRLTEKLITYKKAKISELKDELKALERDI